MHKLFVMHVNGAASMCKLSKIRKLSNATKLAISYKLRVTKQRALYIHWKLHN